MKRPLVVITAGFVLGEVLALCLQEAVYRTCFWLFGLLFFAVLAVRRFWGINLSRSVIYRTLLLFFILFFGGMTAGSFLGGQCRERMEEEEKMISQAEWEDVVQVMGTVVDLRGQTVDDSSVSPAALWIAGGDRRLGRKTPSWEKS